MTTGQTIILTGLSSRQRAENIVNAAPSGSVMTVKPPTRSTEQNARMWAMLSDISRAMPDGRRLTPDVWKAVFMNACGHAVQFETGLSGEPFPVGFRSSRLTKGQMGELMDFMEAFAAERGIRLSQQDEAA